MPERWLPSYKRYTLKTLQQSIRKSSDWIRKFAKESNSNNTFSEHVEDLFAEADDILSQMRAIYNQLKKLPANGDFIINHKVLTLISKFNKYVRKYNNHMKLLDVRIIEGNGIKHRRKRIRFQMQ